MVPWAVLDFSYKLVHVVEDELGSPENTTTPLTDPRVELTFTRANDISRLYVFILPASLLAIFLCIYVNMAVLNLFIVISIPFLLLDTSSLSLVAYPIVHIITK